MEEQLKLPEFNPYFEKILKSYIDITSTTIMKSTSKSHSTAIKYFLRYIAENYPEITNLSDLKRSPHVESWLSYISSGKLCKATRNLKIMTVRKFLHDIYEWEWKDAPQPGLLTSKDMPHLDDCLPKPIPPEIDMKLQKYLKTKNTLWAQALLLLRKTGMRIGELQNLELNCLEKLADGNYVLHVPLGKLHTERNIPVDNETAKIINHIIECRPLSLLNPLSPKGNQYLLVKHNSARPSYAGLRDALVRYTTLCGITMKISPHQLRHTYATELLRAGMNLTVLMKLLGHKDITMTLRYVGFSPLDLQQAYHMAIKNTKNLNLLVKSHGTVTSNQIIDNFDYVLQEISASISKMESIYKDTNDKNRKKKLHRLLERLRRIYSDMRNVK